MQFIVPVYRIQHPWPGRADVVADRRRREARLIERHDLQMQPAPCIFCRFRSLISLRSSPCTSMLNERSPSPSPAAFGSTSRTMPSTVTHGSKHVEARRQVHAAQDITVDAAVSPNDTWLRRRRTSPGGGEGRLKEMVGQAPLTLLEDEKRDVRQRHLVPVKRDAQTEPQLCLVSVHSPVVDRRDTDVEVGVRRGELLDECLDVIARQRLSRFGREAPINRLVVLTVECVY